MNNREMIDAVFVEKVVGAYRDNHNYLFQSTSLHIFVMTNTEEMDERGFVHFLCLQDLKSKIL